jgi:hypothetical protein
MNSDFLFVVLQHQFFINVIERLFWYYLKIMGYVVAYVFIIISKYIRHLMIYFFEFCYFFP